MIKILQNVNGKYILVFQNVDEKYIFAFQNVDGDIRRSEEGEIMKIWLDDLRPAPWGYESARSVNEAKTLIREAERNGIEIEVLDLDHDLGDFSDQGGDAIKLLDWLAERETFYPVEIHTANPVGRANMESVLARYWGEEYW